MGSWPPFQTFSNFFKIVHNSDNKSNNGVADGYGKHRPICLRLQKAQEGHLIALNCHVVLGLGDHARLDGSGIQGNESHLFAVQVVPLL